MPNREDSDLSENIKKARKEYTRAALSEEMMLDSPFDLFEQWFSEATTAGIGEPNAMALATVDTHGAPHVRYVLMKEFSEAGFVFYTNSNSLKGQHLQNNPRTAAVFYWRELERQIRVEGEASIVDAHTADTYFASRPAQAQRGAIASQQSEPLADRSILEQKVEELKEAGEKLKRPPHWNGYRIAPIRFEFWQGRENRLHDRFEYLSANGGSWTYRRLYP